MFLERVPGRLDQSLDQSLASESLSQTQAVKDEAAVVNVRKASTITQKVLKNGIVRMIEDVFDQESTVTHEELARRGVEKAHPFGLSFVVGLARFLF